jgi:hypothetical protein
MTTLIASAVLLLCTAGAGSAAGPPFVDRTGDAPARFDITRVDVSEQPGGSVFIEVTIAGTFNWDEGFSVRAAAAAGNRSKAVWAAFDAR